MRLLVFGGTQFVGRHIVDASLRAGHQVTLFHRGTTNPGLFPEAEEILGDRDGGLAPLEKGRWDAVIDVNGYVPRLARDSVRALTGRAEAYTYISTLSVLADYSIPHQDERAPRAPFEGVDTEEITAKSYGPLKAACEAVVEREWPGRALVVRPGYVVGPWDHTGRFPSWVRRVSQGGEMLAPGRPGAPAQFIDGRDLAAFVVRATQEGRSGTFHATGPRDGMDWGRLLGEMKRVTGSDADFVWVPEEFLAELTLPPGSFPMWTPSSYDGLERTSIAKGLEAGLVFRPLAETIRDTFEWDREHGRHDVGLSAEREREVLEAWKSRQPA